MVGDDLLCAEFISIHLPVGVGQIRKEIPLRRAIFQSTHPVRGGTRAAGGSLFAAVISIHPPRAGWDCDLCPLMETYSHFNPPTPCGVGLRPQCRSRCPEYFNPPTPCGVGQRIQVTPSAWPLFQSTHPVRGGTRSAFKRSRSETISIHPPRAGWDGTQSQKQQDVLISIHPPRAGWDH